MANNLFANIPAAVIATQDISFADAGIDFSKIRIIHLVGSPYQSFRPEREINSITAFENGKGYLVWPKANLDFSAFLAPPITVMPLLATPANFSATPGNAQVALNWDDVPNATSYVVERALNAGFTGIVSTIYTGSTSAYLDASAANTVHYYYRVKATASGFLTSGYATANATPVPGVTIADINYSTAALYTAAGTTWTSGGAYNTAKAVSAQKIPSANSGRIYFTAKAGAIGAIFGLNTVGTNDNFSAYAFGFYLSSATDLNKVESGSLGFAATVSLTATDLLSLNKTGSVMTIEKSTDAGATWTVVYTFGTPVSSDLYPAINGNTGSVVIDPKGVGLV